MPIISVIIPIYNVEKYLQKCVESVLKQSLRDIEVILVNDGSPDGCDQLIEDLKMKDSRVKTIYKENGGQSSARNAGLEIATGEYISFVDPDDWVEPNMYLKLYERISQTDSDLAICGRKSYNEKGSIGTEIIPENRLIDFDLESKSEYIIKNFFYPHTASSCNKLYKRNVITRFGLSFKDVKYVGSEDTLFNYEYLCQIKKIVCLSDTLYCVLNRKDSTVRTYMPGYMKRTSNLIQCLHDYSIQTNNLSLYKSVSPFFFLYYYQWNIDRIRTLNNKYLREILRDEIQFASKSRYFKESNRRIVFDLSLTKVMKSMGYRFSGILFLKLCMLLSLLNMHHFSARLRLLRS